MTYMKSKTNLHLFLSNIESENRLFKEARYTVSNNIFARVVVLGLWADGLLESEEADYGLAIFRLKTTLRRFHGEVRDRKILRRLLSVISLFEYFFAALMMAFKLRPSHVSCHNAFLLPVSWVIACLVGGKLVYVPHELETERTGLSGFAKAITAFIERLFIRSCSATVLVCDPIADWYRSKYDINNVYVVRNLPSSIDAVLSDSKPDLFRSLFAIEDKRPIVIYQGVLGQERGILELLHYFALNKVFHLVLMGYGELEQKCVKYAGVHENIHFKSAVPINEIIKYAASADFGIFVVGGSLSLSYQYCLPNKFFEYLHAGLPVIVSSNMTYLAQIVDEFALGLVIDCDDMGALAIISQMNYEVASKNVINYSRKCLWEVDAIKYFDVYSV